MTTINDVPETQHRLQVRPQSSTVQPGPFTQVVEILWQHAVEEYPAWSHEQKRNWAERTANQMFAENAGSRPPAFTVG